ncbi:MAG TPA: TonB family protein [Acidobacteriaceae bacterium]|jgi:TonB family protein|nr:TonB family protein [Acidobacteriaceae bacterium]
MNQQVRALAHRVRWIVAACVPLLCMAATQTPPSPPERPSEPQLDGSRSRYESYEHHELISLIDNLEDDRSRARVREGIWVSIIFHLLFFWFLIYGPHVLFHRPLVVNPADVFKKHDAQIAYLNLPPDALKALKPKPTNIISDKDRVAQSKRPTLDKKTLEELQAMQRAGNPAPPPPQPAPQQQAQAAPPQPQQQQQAPPSEPKPQPNEQARMEAPSAPRPQASEQQLNQNSNMSVGEMIRQAEKNAAKSNGQFGENGENAPLAHPGMQSGVQVLSDTMGVDFGPYLRQVVEATQNSWDILIPEAARAPLLKKGKVAIQFIIAPDGSVKQMQLILPSGDVSLDRAAWGGITGAAPFPPLPKQFKGPYLALRFYFLYNERPGEGGSQ